MTEPTPTPDPTVDERTAADLDKAIVAENLNYIYLVTHYPRDAARIAASKAAITDLRAARAALG